MEGYKREFIKFLESAGVLKFGDFTAKSGRKIPYFINAGDIKTGDQISKLGEFYAKGYFEKVVTTNLNYLPPEIYERPYYVQANMSKFIASIIDFMNHDLSMENVHTPAEKIHQALKEYNERIFGENNKK